MCLDAAPLREFTALNSAIEPALIKGLWNNVCIIFTKKVAILHIYLFTHYSDCNNWNAEHKLFIPVQYRKCQRSEHEEDGGGWRGDKIGNVTSWRKILGTHSQNKTVRLVCVPYIFLVGPTDVVTVGAALFAVVGCETGGAPRVLQLRFWPPSIVSFSIVTVYIGMIGRDVNSPTTNLLRG